MPPGGSRGKVVLMTGGYDHTIRFWEAHSGMCIKTLQYPDTPINLLRVSPDKKWLAVAGNPHTRLFKTDASAQSYTHSFDGHTGNVICLVFTPGIEATTMWTGSEDQTIKFWDLRAASSQRDFKCKFPVNTVARHPTKDILMSGDQGGYIRMWDLTMGRCVRELQPEPENAIRWLSFSPNGKLLSAVTNLGSCYIWKIGASETAASGHDKENGATNNEAGGDDPTGPDSVQLEVGNGDHSMKSPLNAADQAADVQQDLLPMRPLKQIQAHQTYALKCLFSPDSRLLATCSADHTVKLWSLPSFKQEHTFSGHQRWVWDCEFSSDSNFLVTGSSDNTARSWNLALGDTICHFNGHHKAIISVALCDTTS